MEMMLIITIVYIFVILLLTWGVYSARKKYLPQKTVADDSVKTEISKRGVRARKNNLTCAGTLLSLAWFGISVAVPMLILWGFHSLQMPEGYTVLKADVLFAPFVAAMFLGIGVVAFLPFCSESAGRKAESDTFRRLVIREDSVAADNERGILNTVYVARTAVLFLFVFMFPFYGLGLSHYGAYNENGVVYHAYFAVQPYEFEYDRLAAVERRINPQSDSKSTSAHFVLTNGDGKEIDILFGGYVAQTYKIYTYIKDKNPDLINNLPPTAHTPEISGLLSYYTAREQAMMIEIFNILPAR